MLNDQRQQDKRKEESAETITQASKKLTPERSTTSSPVNETSKTNIGETQPDKRYYGNGRFPHFSELTTKDDTLRTILFLHEQNSNYINFQTFVAGAYLIGVDFDIYSSSFVLYQMRYCFHNVSL